MAVIILERSNEMNNRLRSYGVYLDEKKVGEIRNGETKEFQTTPGVHSIQCKIDWCSSPLVKIDLQENNIKVLSVGGFKNGKWIMPLSAGIAGLACLLNIFQVRAIFLYIILVPPFVALVYFLSWGRKQYLTLREK